MGFAIAIDGPAGAGKSSIAKTLAAKLDMIYVDTGALYRAIGLAVWRRAGETDDEEIICATAGEVTIELTYNEKGQHVILDGEDVSEVIRKEEIGRMASVVSAIPFVREKLLDLQRNMAKMNAVVMDGRDIGSRILPDAEVKIFLVCPAEERARRRLVQLEEHGDTGDYEQILKDIKERDHRDSTRAASPLIKVADAVEFDTTGHTAETSAEAIIKLCKLSKERIHA